MSPDLFVSAQQTKVVSAPTHQESIDKPLLGGDSNAGEISASYDTGLPDGDQGTGVVGSAASRGWAGLGSHEDRAEHPIDDCGYQPWSIDHPGGGESGERHRGGESGEHH